MTKPVTGPDTSAVRLFCNNRSQAADMPAALEFFGSGGQAITDADSGSRLLDTLRNLSPLDSKDVFPDDLDASFLPLSAGKQ